MMPCSTEIRLGILYPGADDTELMDLRSWLHERGQPIGDYVFARSTSNGRHDEHSLLATGSSETLSDALTPMVGRVDAVAWACTSGSFIGGCDLAERQAQEMRRIVGGPATTTSLALVAALEMLGADRIDAISPYPTEVTERLIEFMESNGFTIGACTSLGAPSGAASRALRLHDAIDNHIARYGNRSTPLMIPDTAIDTLHLVDHLEEHLLRPVITANQATIWHLLRIVGGVPILPRAGRLFKCEGVPR